MAKPTKTSLQRELRTARILIEEQATKINSLNVTAREQDAQLSRVLDLLQKSNREIARLNGYIDRVREAEGRSTYEVGVARDADGPMYVE